MLFLQWGGLGAQRQLLARSVFSLMGSFKFWKREAAGGEGLSSQVLVWPWGRGVTLNKEWPLWVQRDENWDFNEEFFQNRGCLPTAVIGRSSMTRWSYDCSALSVKRTCASILLRLGMAQGFGGLGLGGGAMIAGWRKYLRTIIWPQGGERRWLRDLTTDSLNTHVSMILWVAVSLCIKLNNTYPIGFWWGLEIIYQWIPCWVIGTQETLNKW